MNNVTLIGRLTKDPDGRYSADGKAVTKYTLAVDRWGKDAGADFITCVAFGKAAEFAAKYLSKGTKVAVNGRIQTGSYTSKTGQKVYTTDVVVTDHEFCEAKQAQTTTESDFMSIPDGDSEGLPFC